ncbi:MAG: antitoxin AF2212-like protein [Hormoscilla sp.]
MEMGPEIIAAVYENGVLRPTVPVSLSEGQNVRLRVVPEVALDRPKTELDKAFQLMVDQGWMTVPTEEDKIDPDLEEKWRTVFEKLKERPGKPLSEIIIEDRGAW